MPTRLPYSEKLTYIGYSGSADVRNAGKFRELIRDPRLYLRLKYLKHERPAPLAPLFKKISQQCPSMKFGLVGAINYTFVSNIFTIIKLADLANHEI